MSQVSDKNSIVMHPESQRSLVVSKEIIVPEILLDGTRTPGIALMITPALLGEDLCHFLSTTALVTPTQLVSVESIDLVWDPSQWALSCSAASLLWDFEAATQMCFLSAIPLYPIKQKFVLSQLQARDLNTLHDTIRFKSREGLKRTPYVKLESLAQGHIRITPQQETLVFSRKRNAIVKTRNASEELWNLRGQIATMHDLAVYALVGLNRRLGRISYDPIRISMSICIN